MYFERLTIKTATIGMLCIIAILFIITTIFTSQRYISESINSQKQTLTRVMSVASQEVLSEVEQLAEEVASAVANTKSIKKAVKSKDKMALAALLDDFYAQAFVTDGIVDLVKLRVYDKQGQFIAASQEGESNLAKALPLELLQAHQQRTGKDKMKVIGHFWTDDEEFRYSVLMPTGGLRVSGYVEVVVKPAHNMKRLAELLKAPIRLLTANGQVIHQSDTWSSMLNQGNAFVIGHSLLDSNGNIGMQAQMLEDNREFIARTQMLEYTGIGATLVISIVVTLLTIAIFHRYLFIPMAHLKDEMLLCSSGDLSHKVLKEGFLDTQNIGEALNQFVSTMRAQVHDIDEMAKLVSDNSSHIASVANMTQNYSDEQKFQMEQAASAINQMSSAAAEIAEGAQNAENAAHESLTIAQNGEQVVTDSIDAVKALAEHVEKASGSISELATDIENIGSISETIGAIAEQTNLLALNAAIEAARAGEQGRGFAVVADEVRNLAARTQESTQQIKSMLDRLQQGAGATVSVMNSSSLKAQDSVEQIYKAGVALQEIKTAADKISMSNSQIASAAEQQSAVTEEIDKSITSVADSATELAAGCTQMSGSSNELNQAASQLKNLVAKFIT